jgi:ribosomal protein S27E
VEKNNSGLIMSYGYGGFGDDLKLKAQLVNGVCPTCKHAVIFISLCKDFFRCTICGTDLEQKINGKISYIPAVLSKDKIKFELTSNESKKI